MFVLIFYPMQIYSDVLSVIQCANAFWGGGSLNALIAHEFAKFDYEEQRQEMLIVSSKREITIKLNRDVLSLKLEKKRGNIGTIYKMK